MERLPWCHFSIILYMWKHSHDRTEKKSMECQLSRNIFMN